MGKEGGRGVETHKVQEIIEMTIVSVFLRVERHTISQKEQ